MSAIETTQNVPFSVASDGTIRIAETRVSLDSVLHHYRQGATADEITLRFPALRLADVHSCLAYYLNHQDELDEYLAQRRQAADELQRQISAGLLAVAWVRGRAASFQSSFAAPPAHAAWPRTWRVPPNAAPGPEPR